MAAGEVNSVVSVPSSTPDPSTLPSSPNQAGTDSPMGEGDDDATFHEGEGESLSNRPSSSHVRQGIDAMADESEEADHCKEWIIMQMTPPPISRSLQSNGGLRPSRDPGDLNSKSSDSLQGKNDHSPRAASRKIRNGPSHWGTWQT